MLEHGYLERVERPHGLPTAARQRRDASSVVVYRDAAYDGLLVELDGRDHARADRRAEDLDRGLQAALEGQLTVRLGWMQVFDRPCWTAERVARLLQLRGWTGRPVQCSPACLVVA